MPPSVTFTDAPRIIRGRHLIDEMASDNKIKPRPKREAVFIKALTCGFALPALLIVLRYT
jgi:hypothetical protein